MGVADGRGVARRVVVIRDPLDPDVRILRRIVAVGGQSIAMDDHLIRVGNRRLRTAAMGDSGDYVVTRETLWAKKPAVGRRAHPLSPG